MNDAASNIVIGGIIGVFIALVILVIAAISGFITAWAWNLIVPLIWKSAPHLLWYQGIALGILFGLVKGVFYVKQTVETK